MTTAIAAGIGRFDDKLKGKATSFAEAGKGKKTLRSCSFAGMIRIMFKGSLCYMRQRYLSSLTPPLGHFFISLHIPGLNRRRP